MIVLIVLSCIKSNLKSDKFLNYDSSMIDWFIYHLNGYISAVDKVRYYQSCNLAN